MDTYENTNQIEKSNKRWYTAFIISIASLFTLVGVGLSFMTTQYKKTSAVSYDDENYLITLSVDELNNYQYSNLAPLIYNYQQDLSLTYNLLNSVYGGVYYATQDFDGYAYGFQNQDDYVIAFIYDYDTWKGEEGSISESFRLGQNNFFYPNFEDSLFISTIDIECSALSYDDIKQALELDMQANQPAQNNMGNVLTDFVDLLVGGIVSLAGAIATGVSTMAQALFLKVEGGVVVGLSTFGGIVAIFAGLALAVAITTKVYMWITSLGN